MSASRTLRESYHTSHFERLPRELRNKVYTLCLRTDAAHETNLQTAVKCGVPCIGILLTNKAIHKESAAILYGNCTFHCTIEDNSHGFRQFLNTIGDSNASAIKTLCIRSTFDDARHKAAVRHLFSILFTKCPRLRTLCIEALPVAAAPSLTDIYGNSNSAVRSLAVAATNVMNNVISSMRTSNLENVTRLLCWLIDQYGHKSCAFIGFDVTHIQTAESKIRATVNSHERRKELERQLVRVASI